MIITANEIISRVWGLANVDPGKTGQKRGSQKRAFKLLLDIRGGVAFLACRPRAELEELGRRGICSTKTGAILRKIAEVELQKHRGLITESACAAQIRKLMREMVRSPRPNNPARRNKASRVAFQ